MSKTGPTPFDGVVFNIQVKQSIGSEVGNLTEPEQTVFFHDFPSNS